MDSFLTSQCDDMVGHATGPRGNEGRLAAVVRVSESRSKPARFARLDMRAGAPTVAAGCVGNRIPARDSGDSPANLFINQGAIEPHH